MSDATLPRTPQADAAFDAWWPRHAAKHNSRSPVAAREAFTAGWGAAADAGDETLTHWAPDLGPVTDGPPVGSKAACGGPWGSITVKPEWVTCPACARAAGAAAERREMARERDLMHADLGDLLEACGLGNYARPQSPHEVMQAAIAKVRDIVETADSSAIIRAWESTDLYCQPLTGWQDAGTTPRMVSEDGVTFREEVYEATCPQCGSRDEYSEPHPRAHTCGHVIPQPVGVPADVLAELVEANRISLAASREVCLACYDEDHGNCQQGKPGITGWLIRCKCLCKPASKGVT